MQKCKLWVCSILFAAVMAVASVSGASDLVMLQREGWDPTVRQSINEMFVLYGKGSPNYNPSIRPYAVFDFDNTVSILDVEEQLAIYQLEHMRFAIKPEQMYAVLTTGVPDINMDLGKEFNNLTVAKVAADAAAAYKRLYSQGYVSPVGVYGEKMQKMQAGDDWKEFATKVRWLYDAIGDTMDVSVSYPWITYWFTGMTSQQVYGLAHEAFVQYRKASADPAFWQKRKWQSPAGYKGSKAGQVSVSYKQGITVSAEIQELFHALEANGFDAWVCSASFIDVISAAVSPEVFGIEGVDGVLAMTNKEQNGKYLNEYDYAYQAQTQGCDVHLLIPDLVPYGDPQDGGENWIAYRHKDTGEHFLNGPAGIKEYGPNFSSKDLHNCNGTLIADVLKLKAEFPVSPSSCQTMLDAASRECVVSHGASA